MGLKVSQSLALLCCREMGVSKNNRWGSKTKYLTWRQKSLHYFGQQAYPSYCTKEYFYKIQNFKKIGKRLDFQITDPPN